MRIFTLLLTLLFSQAVFAVEYFWVVGTDQYGTTHYPSAISACNSVYPYVVSGRTYVYSHYESVSASSGLCAGYWTATPGSFVKRAVNRFGDSCEEEGAVYNPATGACEVPEDQCADKAGQTSPFNKSGNGGDGYYSTVSIGGKRIGVTPGDGCLSGCAVVVKSDCVFTISTNRYSCAGIAHFTGTSCEATTPQVEQEENYVPNEPERTEKEEPCVYVPDAEGRMHCVSKKSTEQEGQNCGTYNGEQLCVPKEATKNDNNVETEVKETPNEDGGKTVVKKDTATETKCTGTSSNCTTSTTVTTTTTKYGADGKPVSTEVTCKGARCGTGTGGGSGGGNGNGNGDGEGEEEGEGGELPGNDDVPGFGDLTKQFMARVQSAPILDAVTGIQMPGGGSCSLPSFNVYLIGSVSFNFVCQLSGEILDPLYYIMLAVWALAAVRVFLEA